MEIDDNLHYAAHAQKLVRTGFSSLNQFSYPVKTSLVQFLHGSQWQSTLHCTLSMTIAHAQKLVRTGLSSLIQFSYPVRTSLIQFLDQFEPVSTVFFDNLHYTAHAQLIRTGLSSMN